MGVRTYTSDMLPSENAAGWTKAAHVIVDWSQPQSAPAAEAVQMEDLVRWIRTYPERTAVHVYLRRSLTNTRGRLLRNTLQSMGCTVTMRSKQSVLV